MTSNSYERVLQYAHEAEQQKRESVFRFSWRHFKGAHSGRSITEKAAQVSAFVGFDVSQAVGQVTNCLNTPLDRDKVDDIARYAGTLRRIQTGAEKMCSSCREVLPATVENFYTDRSKMRPSNPHGLRSKCKTCDNLGRVNRRAQ